MPTPGPMVVRWAWIDTLVSGAPLTEIDSCTPNPVSEKFGSAVAENRYLGAHVVVESAWYDLQ